MFPGHLRSVALVQISQLFIPRIHMHSVPELAASSLTFIAFCVQARYEILRSCLTELQRVSIVSPACSLPPPFQDLRPSFVTSNGMLDGQAKVIDTENSFGPSQMAGEKLKHVAEACEVGCCHEIFSVRLQQSANGLTPCALPGSWSLLCNLLEASLNRGLLVISKAGLSTFL